MKKIIKAFISKYVDEITDTIGIMERMTIEERQTIRYATMNLHLNYLFLKVEICEALIGVKW